MTYLINKNNITLSVCDSIELIYHNILLYYKILYSIKNDNNMMYNNFFKEITIFQYNNSVISNILYINTETFYLYNSDNIKINYNSNIILYYISEIKKLFNNYISNDSDMKIHLPINNNDDIDDDDIDEDDNDDNEEDNNNEDNDKEDNDKEDNFKDEEKKQKIEKLREKILIEQNRLIDNNKRYEEKVGILLKNKRKLNLLKSRVRQRKEKSDEKKRIYNVALNMYNTLISEINNNVRDKDDIPELFTNDFIIFDHIYTNFNNLSDDEKYIKYKQLNKIFIKDNMNVNTNFDELFQSNILCNDDNLMTDSNYIISCNSDSE